jgi:hypothetical protein
LAGVEAVLEEAMAIVVGVRHRVVSCSRFYSELCLQCNYILNLRRPGCFVGNFANRT